MHGLLVEARAEARLEVLADADDPLAAEGGAVEVVDVEGERVRALRQILHQHVVVDARVDRPRTVK